MENKRKIAELKRTQEWLPEIDFIDNLAIVKNPSGIKYIKIMEVRPIPFFTMPIEEQNRIYEQFFAWIRTAPKRWGICVSTMDTDVASIVDYVKNKQLEETNEKVRYEIDKYIAWIQKMSIQNSIDRKTYLYFEYTKGEGLNVRAEADIVDYMDNKAIQIAMDFNTMGVHVINDGLTKSEDVINILYRFLNKKTSRKKSLHERFQLMNRDAAILQQTQTPSVDVRNYFAPTYIDDRNEQYIVLDGTYYTVLYMTPMDGAVNASIGWIGDMTDFGTNVSVNIQFESTNHDTALNRVEQSARITRGLAAEGKEGSATEAKMREKANLDYIASLMRQGEDLLKTYLVVTINAPTLKELFKIKKTFQQRMKRNYLRMETCSNHMGEAIKMSLPIGYRSPAVMKNAENTFLTSAVATMFPFTDYTISDACGAVIAIDDSEKLVRYDPFETSERTNANGVVIGMSGSGKTFAMNIFLRRLRLMGIKIRLVLPIKGYNDYYGSTQSVAGTFVKMMPGSENCINFFEIPYEEETYENMSDYSQKSLLSKKIQDIRSWLILRSRQTITENEKNIANMALYNMYKDYGITEDNLTVKEFAATGKDYPTFSTLYEYLKKYTELKAVADSIRMFVDGQCKNLNGQTNVDLSNKWVAFDVDKTQCGDVLPEYYFIAMSIATADARRFKTEYCILFYDEVQEVTRIKETAESVEEQYATLRGYGAGVWCATQHASNLAQIIKDGETSQSIISNAATKILMLEDPAQAQYLRKCFDLTPAEMKYVTQPHRGEGLFLAGGCHSKVHFISSEEEFWIFNTDPKAENQRKR